MRDQAAELRSLVLRAARQNPVDTGPPSRLVALTGGKGGVGATTLAVNLSVALAQQGARVVLVDADLYRADVAALCSLPEQASVADVLMARRDIHEVLQRGPAGIQVLPGVWAPGPLTDCSEKAQRRLIDQLRTLGRHADVVILDVGNQPSEFVLRFWEAASEIVLVSTADSISVMDTYATIKTLAPSGHAVMRLLVNQAAAAHEAVDVHRRIDQSCQRFLGREVGLLGFVPPDEQVAAAARAGVPVVLASPACPATREIERVAVALAAKEPLRLAKSPTAVA
jgi:flagellar biosynthesis protein FlhG